MTSRFVASDMAISETIVLTYEPGIESEPVGRLEAEAEAPEPAGLSGLLAPLSGLQQRALAILVQGGRVGHIAEELGVHRSTIHRWLARPEFGKALSVQRDELIERTFELQVFAANQAVSRLIELLDSDDDRVALGAARALVPLKEAYMSMDHERRIRHMEDIDPSMYGQ